jgi:crotonobetainyl-CoA:carnitine CoA-transferase CaiB-like acyl-CoA transferase
LARQRGQGCHYAAVSLADAAAFFAQPLQRGVTAAGGRLGGGFPGYNVYETQEGWIAVAALEPHFWLKITAEVGVPAPTHEQLQAFFRQRTAVAWEKWALERDLPISVLN